MASNTATRAALSTRSAAQPSRVTSIVAYPTAVTIALGTSAALYSACAQWTGFELSTVSRSVDDPVYIGILVAWRVAELTLSWFAGFDYWDTASLFLLTNAPFYSLLPLFYSITPASIAISIAIDVLSITLPIALFRPVQLYNSSSTKTPGLASSSIRLYIATFATALYSAFLYAGLQTVLPSFIVSTLEVRSLEPAYAANLPILLAAFVPLGNAAKDFLFTPSIFAAKTLGGKPEFDARTATFGETLAYNVGLSGWSVREDVLLSRTILLALLTVGSSLVRIWGTVAGADFWGAVTWATVFVLAHGAVGVGLGYVGDV